MFCVKACVTIFTLKNIILLRVHETRVALKLSPTPLGPLLTAELRCSPGHAPPVLSSETSSSTREERPSALAFCSFLPMFRDPSLPRLLLWLDATRGPWTGSAWELAGEANSWVPSRRTESGSGLGPSAVCLNKPSRGRSGVRCMLKCDNCCSRPCHCQ